MSETAGLSKDPSVEEHWRHGRCYPMACALSEKLGWPIEALVVDFPSKYRDVPDRIHLVHAWVVSPDGRAFDAGGFFERESLREEFLSPGRRGWENDRIESYGDVTAFLSSLKTAYGRDEEWETRFMPDWMSPEIGRAAAAADDYVLRVYSPEPVGCPAPGM